MKPDWKDAPEWANYLAMDHDGSWEWFEKKPVVSELFPCSWDLPDDDDDDYGESCSAYIDGWKETLEARPE